MLLSKVNKLSESKPIECPICLFACRDKDDFESVVEHGACTECFINFRYLLGESWDKGVRPSISKAREKMGYES